MYRLLMSALLLFPWLLVIHIALGAFRTARRRTAARKQIEEGNPMKPSKTLTQLICAFCVPALALAAMTFPLPVSAHAPGVVLLGEGTATIDGAISPGEWDDAGCVSLPVSIPGEGTTPGTACAMNSAQIVP